MTIDHGTKTLDVAESPRAKTRVYHDGVMTFGKYKNKPVAEVVKDDPRYIAWMRESGYGLDDELLAFAAEFERQNWDVVANMRAKMKTDGPPKGPVPPLSKNASPAKVEREKDLAWGSW